MGHEGDGDSGHLEYLDVGPRRRTSDVMGVRRLIRWVPLLLAIGAVLVAAIVVVHRRDAPARTARYRGSSPAVSVLPPPISDTVSVPSRLSRPVTVRDLGRALLDEHGRWELFGRGDGFVVRVQVALGRVTLSAVPPLASSGPVSFIVGAHGALVRPIDYVRGYLVPDGRPAIQAPGLLDEGGWVFPGPDPDHVWVQSSGDGPQRMVLVQVDGHPTGVSLPVPAGGSPFTAFPDDAGFLVFPADGGTFDVHPNRSTRVTAGTVLAVGPTRFLTTECDRASHCGAVIVDRTTQTRRALDIAVPSRSGSAGVISPDGTLAALVTQSPRPSVQIIDLASGAAYPLTLGAAPITVADWRTLVWSPDSRWLFTPNDSGHLCAVNAHTHEVIDLNPAIGPSIKINQIAIRNTH